MLSVRNSILLNPIPIAISRALEAAYKNEQNVDEPRNNILSIFKMV